MKRHHLGLALSLALSLPVTAGNRSSNTPEELENIIVTGSYSPVTETQITSSAIIIDRDELLALSPSSLVDALRQVPSLWVESQGGPGGLTSIILRGAESNHTLVLIDGVQLNDPTNSRGGSFDLSHLNIQSIKRIEIIRGAQSSIYGSDALAGVIQIFTMEPGSETQVNAFASIGSSDYYSYGAGISGSVHNIGYSLNAQNKDAGEPLDGSTAKNTSVETKLNWLNDEHRLDFSYRYFDGENSSYPEQSGGPKFAISRDLNSSEYRDQQAALSWQWQVSPQWKSRVNTSWFNRIDDSQSPGIVPYTAVPASGTQTDFTRTATTWINTLGEQQYLWANVGLETKHEEGTSNGFLDLGFAFPTEFDLSRRINSAFVNVNALVAQKWLLQATVRHDDPQGVASNQSVQLGVRYQLNQHIHLILNRGEGFKLPSFFALGHSLVGNPDLQPETSITLEAGIGWERGQFNASANYFDNEYRDLIDFDAELFTNVNRATVDIQGFDGQIQWQSLNQQWQISGQFNYSDIDAPNPLNGRPKITLGSRLEYAPTRQWRYNLNALWVDQRYATSLYTGEAVQQTLDSYWRVDANVMYQYDTHWQLAVNLQNITDSDYQNDIGFAANGPAFYLNASYAL